jgi:tetratricopeptide (TPR) repeat protein
MALGHTAEARKSIGRSAYFCSRTGAPVVHSFLLLLGLAFQALSPEAVRHAQAGVAAQKAGHMDEAIQEFKKVTELAPQLAAAFVNLGAAYMQTGQYTQAIEPLKRALELNSDLPGAQQMLGVALLSAGYAEEAVPHLESSGALNALGVAQLKTGKLPEAIATLQAALAKTPNDPDLLYYLGQASGLLSKHTFDSLLAHSPDSARAHQSLGDAYAAQRRTAEAEKEYREALRVRPNLPGAHLSIGIVYADSGQWEKAQEEFRAEARLEPGNAEAAYRLGSALLQAGKAAEAKAELERADRLRPEMPETLYALGKAASLAGDAAAAEQAWKRVIAVEGKTSLAAQAHFGLSAIYRKQGKLADAQRELSEYRQLQKQ